MKTKETIIEAMHDALNYDQGAKLPLHVIAEVLIDIRDILVEFRDQGIDLHELEEEEEPYPHGLVVDINGPNEDKPDA